MRQGIVLTGLGIAVWGAATFLFRWFGHWLLVDREDPHFGASIFLLELVTLLLLVGLSLAVRMKLFPARGSATRLGYFGAVVGLMLDTWSLWHREAVFPRFSEGQHQAFAIWLMFAYALTLLVPAVVDRLVREPAAGAAATEEAAGAADAAVESKIGAGLAPDRQPAHAEEEGHR